MRYKNIQQQNNEILLPKKYVILIAYPSALSKVREPKSQSPYMIIPTIVRATHSTA